MIIKTFHQKILPQLKSAGIPYPETETREIFCHVLKKDWAFILAHPEKNITPAQKNKINYIIKKRLAGKPLAYILGYKNFYGLDFKVNKNVLIPRPETELMVEKGMTLLRSMLRNKLRNKKIFCLDVGTGSGCIITALAKNVKSENVKFFGLDISNSVLKIARQNSQKHKVANQINFIQSDLLSFLFPLLEKPACRRGRERDGERLIKNLKFKIKNSNILILANLPYLSEKAYQSAPRSVKSYEPKKALFAGKDGLKYYYKLLDQIKTLKSSNHQLQTTSYKLFLEISPEQKDLIKKEILQRFLEAKIKFYKDLSQKCRLIKIEF